MALAAASVFEEIDGIVAKADKRRRVAMLRQVTNLFLDKAALLDENLIAAFDEVLLRLAQDIDFRVRQALSERFADFPKAPRKVVRDLAFDNSYGIAAPVLERSGRIEENDLVEIVEKKSAMHVLAVSRRSWVSERLSDCIIARGFSEAIRSLTANEGACLSEEAFALLMARSSDDPQMQEALSQRGKPSVQKVGDMAKSARDQVRATLKDGLAERMERAIDAVVTDLTRKFTPERGREFLPEDLEISRQFVATRGKDQKIDDAEIAAWIKRNRMEDALAAIAHLAEIDLDKTVNAFHAPNSDAFLFIARAVGLSWPTFKALLGKKSGRPPPIDMLESAYTVFQKLNPDLARQVLQYAVKHGEALAAGAAAGSKSSGATGPGKAKPAKVVGRKLPPPTKVVGKKLSEVDGGKTAGGGAAKSPPAKSAPPRRD